MGVKRSLMIAGTAATLGVASVVGVASAASDSGTSSQASLVQKVADKFHLNKDDVQKVFDEDKTAKQADREAAYEKRLTQAVTDGKLTADQKTKIEAKHKELQAEWEKDRASMKSERASIDSMTDAERKAAMDKHKTEMDAERTAITKWETDNGIPTGYLDFGGRGGGGHGGPGPDAQ